MTARGDYFAIPSAICQFHTTEILPSSEWRGDLSLVHSEKFG